jgi:hypothetical protein
MCRVIDHSDSIFVPGTGGVKRDGDRPRRLIHQSKGRE